MELAPSHIITAAGANNCAINRPNVEWQQFEDQREHLQRLKVRVMQQFAFFLAQKSLQPSLGVTASCAAVNHLMSYAHHSFSSPQEKLFSNISLDGAHGEEANIFSAVGFNRMSALLKFRPNTRSHPLCILIMHRF